VLDPFMTFAWVPGSREMGSAQQEGGKEFVEVGVSWAWLLYHPWTRQSKPPERTADEMESIASSVAVHSPMIKREESIACFLATK